MAWHIEGISLFPWMLLGQAQLRLQIIRSTESKDMVLYEVPQQSSMLDSGLHKNPFSILAMCDHDMRVHFTKNGFSIKDKYVRLVCTGS